MKRQDIEWETVFGSHSLDKGLTSRINKELKKIKHPKEIIIQLKMGKLLF
jgi:hypothetical protein